MNKLFTAAFLFSTALSASVLAQPVAFGHNGLHAPPVSAETCPTPIQIVSSPTGGKTAMCIGSVVITSGAAVDGLVNAVIFSTFLNADTAKAAAEGGSVQFVNYTLEFAGTMQLVMANYFEVIANQAPKPFNIGGYVMLDTNNQIVVTTIQNNFEAAAPGH